MSFQLPLATSPDNTLPQVVYGSGFSARLSVLLMLKSDQIPVLWVKGSATPLSAPFSPLKTLQEAQSLVRLLKKTDLFDESELQIEEAAFLREYRNKAFKVFKNEDAGELFGTEQYWAGSQFYRLSLSMLEIQARISDGILKSDNVNHLEILEGMTIRGLERNSDGYLTGIRLFTGEVRPASRLILAETPTEITKIEGLTAAFFPLRTRGVMGVIQAELEHDLLGASTLGNEVYMAKLHKEAGETQDRHLWGEFFDHGRKSIWSVVLTNEEAEDHHRVGKRWRRMKQALDRIFVGESWTGQEGKEFTQTIKKERIRFVEDGVFSSGQIDELNEFWPQVEKEHGIEFISEGYGYGPAVLALAALHLEMYSEPAPEHLLSQSEAESQQTI